MLSKEQILSADDLVRERVNVPEWCPAGGDKANAFVYVRELTASEKDQFDAENYVVQGKDVSVNRVNFKARLLARTICNERGEPLFKLKELEGLGRKSHRAMERLAAVALRLSAMTQESQDELLGNSKGGPTDSSPTD